MRHATTPIAGTLAAALTRQERILARRLPGARRGEVVAIHRARVASRRLREILAVAGAVDAERGAGDLLRAVRRVTRALGPTREMDVAIREFDRAAARHGWSPVTVRAVRRRLERERARRANLLSARSARHAAGGLRASVREVAEQMRATPDALWRAALTRRTTRRAHRVLAAAAACGTLYAPERLHALRIAIKKLRYALELVPSPAGGAVEAAIRVLKHAQERFGHLHDVQILAAEVRALDAGRSRAGRAGLQAVSDALERECREIHAHALPLIAGIEAVAREARRRPRAFVEGRPVMAKAGVPAAPDAAAPDGDAGILTK
jgi:CHAD domain-containing protein